SVCPKNQKRCWNKSGEPPECGSNLSLTTSPAGIKKLVPPRRSSTRSRQVGNSTAKASKPTHALINHPQVDSGSRDSVIPLVRRSKVVTMKFSDPRSDATQKATIESPQRFWPQP